MNFKSLLVLSLLTAAIFSIGSAFGNTYTVVNTNDSGVGSLRQAISNANAHSGLDTIEFNIPGAGVQTIAPLTDLPDVTDSVVIDGYTQPGASMNQIGNGDDAVLLIELSGGAGSATIGINLIGGASTVRGLVVNGFSQVGLRVSGTSGSVITGNFIGTDAAGTGAIPNGNGVTVSGGIFPGTNDTTIGGVTVEARNVISGNTSNGVGAKTCLSAVSS